MLISRSEISNPNCGNSNLQSRKCDATYHQRDADLSPAGLPLKLRKWQTPGEWSRGLRGVRTDQTGPLADRVM